MAEPRPLTPAGAAYAARYAAAGQRGIMTLPIAIAALFIVGAVSVAIGGTFDAQGLISTVAFVALAGLWAQRSIAKYRRLERVFVAARDDASLRWCVVQRTILAARDGVPHPELTFRTLAHVIKRAERL
jgi:hypothetical protein